MPVDLETTLREALKTLTGDQQRIARQISVLQGALAALDGGRRPLTTPHVAPVGVRRKRRRAMSAAARRAVSQRMKAYWAKRKAVNDKKPAAPRKQPVTRRNKK